MKIQNFILALYSISILISSCWSSKEISEKINTTKEISIIEKEIDIEKIKYEKDNSCLKYIRDGNRIKLNTL